MLPRPPSSRLRSPCRRPRSRAARRASRAGLPGSTLRLSRANPPSRAFRSSAWRSSSPIPCPRFEGTTAIASSGVSLVHVAVARLGRGEEAEPGRADGKAVLERDHSGVAGTAPAADVPRGQRSRHALAPVVGVVEHVAQEPARPERRLCGERPASVEGLGELDPVAVRVEDVHEPDLPRAARGRHRPPRPAARSRSASALTSGTSTCATPPASSGSPSASAISMPPCESVDQRSWKSTNVSSKPSVSL